MTLRTKFILVLIPLLLISFTGVIFAIYGSTNITTKTGFVKNKIFPVLSQADKLNDHIKSTKSSFIDAINGDEFFAEQIHETQALFNKGVDTLYAITGDSALVNIKKNYNNFVDIALSIGSHILAYPDEFSDNINDISIKAHVLTQQIEKYTQLKEDQFSTALLSIDASSENFINAFIIVGISLLVTMAVLIRIILSSTNTIRELAKDAEVLSKGDLNREIPRTRSDELGTLEVSFERMRSSLNELINDLEFKVEERTKDLNTKNTALNEILNKLRQAQMQLIQSEKMVSLGQLTAGIAHEINNPINFVLNGIIPLQANMINIFELLKLYKLQEKREGKAVLDQINELKEEIEFDDLETEVLELCKSIKIGAKRTSEIVNGLRTFSRSDESEKKLIDVHEGIDSTLAILGSKLKDRIDVIKDYAVLPHIDCYPGQLNQVFMNIISNASQAIGDNPGTITITSKKVDDNTISIGIKDNGPGMSDEIQEKIFEPFFTTKDIGEGTGLGMSITFGIIQKHDGTIKIESEVGVGTEFILLLPIS